MASLQQISHSISVAEDLDSIVVTMKGLAAVNLRHFERARAAAQEYIDALERGLQVVLMHGVEPREEQPARPPVGVIVVGTEQGLCGPLNRRLLEHVGGWLAQESLDRDERRILAIGTRLGDELHAYSLDAEELIAHPSSVQGVTERVEDVLLRIDGWRAEGVTDVVAFHHTGFETSRAHPVTRRILPIELSLLYDLKARDWDSRSLPQVAAEPREMFAALTRHLVVARLFVAIADALASEHGERLIAMQGAETNIEERLQDLQAEYRRERQTAITSELLDLISGYEMISAEERRSLPVAGRYY